MYLPLLNSAFSSSRQPEWLRFRQIPGKSFLIDARRIVQDCEISIRKGQRISRGEIGELAIGYMSALTHDFLGKALEVWRLTSPGILVDCIEMDSVSQERALLEGRISVGILVPSDRPALELLNVRFLTKYPVRLALQKSHPHADTPEILQRLPFTVRRPVSPAVADTPTRFIPRPPMASLIFSIFKVISRTII